MDSPAQATAYAEADFSESNQFFVDALGDHHPGLAERGRLIDLGCGPADICVRLAERLPAWSITGVDAGPNMLDLARRAVAGAGLERRIELKLAYLPDPSLPNGHYDAVVSNSLLHHLPEPATLWQTVRQVGAPGAVVQVMDLERPASDQAAEALVDEYAGDAPDVLRTDFFNSLKAAYTRNEIVAQLDDAGLSGLTVERASDRHWLVHGRLPERR